MSTLSSVYSVGGRLHSRYPCALPDQRQEQPGPVFSRPFCGGSTRIPGFRHPLGGPSDQFKIVHVQHGHRRLNKAVSSGIAPLTRPAPDAKGLPGRTAARKPQCRAVVGLNAGQEIAAGTSAMERVGFGIGTDCLLQAFSWSSPQLHSGQTWYEVLLAAAPDVAAAGFTDVLLPPCSKGSDPQGFLPRSFYDLDSAYGSAAGLRAVMAAFRAAGVRVGCSLAVNRFLSEPPSGHIAWKRARGLPQEAVDWVDWVAKSGDGAAGSPDGPHARAADTLGEEFGTASPIDHSDPMVRDDARGWLSWLRHDVGFDSWCFDYAKGFDPLALHLYVESTRPAFSIGDVWHPMRYNGTSLEYDQDQHRQELCSWVKAGRGSACVLDYTTKGILQMAVERCEYWRLIDPKGRPPGVIGLWPAKAVTFVDNHTTGSTLNHWPFPAWGVMLGYAYILTHPGTPCVFWDHVYDWKLKDQIACLLAVRRRNGIRARSRVRIVACHPDLYVAKVGEDVDSDAFRGVYVKLGPSFDMRGTAPGPSWQVAASGHNFCVWERA